MHSLSGKMFSHPVLLYEPSDKPPQLLLMCPENHVNQKMSGEITSKDGPQVMPMDHKLVIQRRGSLHQ